MELTPELVREMLNGLLLKAKEQRARIPYSKADAYPITVLFFGPNLEPAVMQMTWDTEREKYAKMEAVSKVAQDMLCQAVALVSDTRWVRKESIVKILGVRPLEEIGLEAFKAEYKRIVTERYKGYLGNAPKELFTEAIMIAMKGPRLGGPKSIAAQYEEGPSDSIRWVKGLEFDRVAHFDLLPDWWV